jgi:hypothetical protein
LPEPSVGVAGYAAGVTDFEAGASARAARARHRAMPRVTADPSAPADASQLPLEQDTPAGGCPDDRVRTTADLDAMLALAGVTGAAVPGAAVWPAKAHPVEVPHPAEGAES